MVEESFTRQGLTGGKVCKVPRSFAYSGIFMGSETAAFHLGSIGHNSVYNSDKTSFDIVLRLVLSLADLLVCWFDLLCLP